MLIETIKDGKARNVSHPFETIERIEKRILKEYEEEFSKRKQK